MISLKPIGVVLDKSTIEVAHEWNEALDGISGFSHIIVLYWMHEVTPEKRWMKRAKPCNINQLKGVLATRMPYRPNPIGLSIVKLIRRHGNFLKIDGIDAYKGSPVLDIKPYTGHPKDQIENCRTPAWISKKRIQN
ncbi:tRNA (N6-threonylcarbamoyladenosine(37)-N6)-methyltransferase TrmO [Candidatus Giovannonibacteria bacterium RIFCSPHIGHO2_02_43_13]|uniref:tRNA (N6-threonylcarbamoyladenosine(37)-N6)-methyltransferase TrmO n=1 Tax=Candidatus Giovannonibacteria bacterium RIFCSPHIGHO2_02_43_13 TaxID=1798330 RepID=A0A1F5WQH8_9BACT|nr:MAG: hypothetical protein UW28_C0004G0056 [Parcubacteria group bacterium GW2011_GWA2_44_13]OGF73964.1 MAG: tRNA (N6-threonylcarbamoyladenosine(37)-N6)-methyltransferase TrmO [Candidatus Giovannonibacteria bacterium RIFCSPHIGHO2_12_FULL_44_42]OGF77854.1 MAG: tRNA (N6-threonylcarbamoyladenosine(37)-N6)-methyltransferase TrmO [Candidatus Giovannonibacteria bacterium RIFCSPHIGHO2_02_43_13]OGF88810.1 MAG: tRNA (N6-threonylcarbamoyladenosine(37)-N6)-methyltransferase TrmO [Candidatus Giovannonibact